MTIIVYDYYCLWLSSIVSLLLLNWTVYYELLLLAGAYTHQEKENVLALYRGLDLEPIVVIYEDGQDQTTHLKNIN